MIFDKTTKLAALLVSAVLAEQATAFFPINLQTYQLTYDYSGTNFFNNFDFFTGPDPTNGHVKYVGLTDANATSLAGFMPDIPRNNTKVPPVYLGADYTNIATDGRKSTRVVSNQTFNHALIIADILHMPAPVCGTWPAYWLLGTGVDWPKAGEVDILEGVNDATMNSYTLHTDSGVNILNQTMKGMITTSDCDINASNQDKNVGCSVCDRASAKSYGKAFNDNQGGVFATLIDSTGIRIWFFERHNIPMDIYLGTPNPPSADNKTLPGANSTWSTPNAVFTNPKSDFDAHFKDMQIIFNTAFCGDWAGKVWNSSATCSKLAPTCEDYVSNNPGAFSDAYWAIQSIKVYEPTNATTSPKNAVSTHKKGKSWFSIRPDWKDEVYKARAKELNGL